MKSLKPNNKDLWDIHVHYDFNRVKDYADKGYQDTEEFKDRVEALLASLEYYLRETVSN